MIVPQPLGLMQGHQKPDSFCQVESQLPKLYLAICCALCVLCSVIHFCTPVFSLIIMYGDVGISQDDFSLNYCDCAAHNS